MFCYPTAIHNQPSKILSNIVVFLSSIFSIDIPSNDESSTRACSSSLDCTAQTGHGGHDWQEEVFQKIKSMKDMYLGELNNMHQKITARLKQPESIQWSEQLDKLKIFKAMLERIIAFLSVSSKENITPFNKEKLGSYEKQIVNFVTSNVQQSVNMHESTQTMQHNLSNVQLNSLTSLCGDSSAQQSMLSSLQPGSNMDLGQGNALS
ncbi:hypothetical protein SLEP1_g56621 [Rubroshorea leprosula]|uniref:Uncharacterized protein n=1 Tax=Rubroshorea leprosula TaxID=152421 RepID=A0AAV5MIV4_9ROSI|nr:hypothetical protein SLEP1_g56621 [Rubroshorea leprosula]